MAVLSKNQTLRRPRCEETAPLRVMSSAARRSLGVWEDEEGKRVGRKLQVASRQEKFSFEFRQRFIVHHHQHLAVQLHWPAETGNELIKLTATQRVKHKDYWDINLCPFLHNSSCLWSSGVRVVCAPLWSDCSSAGCHRQSYTSSGLCLYHFPPQLMSQIITP